VLTTSAHLASQKPISLIPAAPRILRHKEPVFTGIQRSIAADGDKIQMLNARLRKLQYVVTIFETVLTHPVTIISRTLNQATKEPREVFCSKEIAQDRWIHIKFNGEDQRVGFERQSLLKILKCIQKCIHRQSLAQSLHQKQ
jgi:hypothetical protein